MMRRVAPVFLILTLLTGCAGMRGASEPANAIYVGPAYSAQRSFNEVARELEQRGYSFEQIDPVFGAIRTDPESIGGGVRVQIAVDVVSANPAELRLWGWYRTSEGIFRIVETSEEGTPGYRAWQELRDIAEWIPGSISR